MPRMIFGLIGILITAGFGVWRYTMVSDLNDQMSLTAFDAPGMPVDAGVAPPGDLQALSTPTGAFNYLNYVAQTLAEADAEYSLALDQQFQNTGALGLGSAGSTRTSSRVGGRVLSIAPAPGTASAASGDCGLDGDGCAGASTLASPAQVRVIRPRY